jgi:hypothetical protein
MIKYKFFQQQMKKLMVNKVLSNGSTLEKIALKQGLNFKMAARHGLIRMNLLILQNKCVILTEKWYLLSFINQRFKIYKFSS